MHAKDDRDEVAPAVGDGSVGALIMATRGVTNYYAGEAIAFVDYQSLRRQRMPASALAML
eukprot:1157750-Pelagomonas_calceolata.AAC.10